MDFHGSGLDFLRISWIWDGFSMEFMDFGWISMDLDWIFYGFHGSGVDFSWNSWFSAWEHFSLCLLFSYGVLAPSKVGEINFA